MERVTKTNLIRREGALNRALRAPIRVEVSGRNGSTALDLCDDSGTIRLLTIGTKRSVYDYMGAMLEALAIVGRDVDGGRV